MRFVRNSSTSIRIADIALATAARRLVESTLGAHAGQQILIIHDEAHRDIAQGIADAAATMGAQGTLIALEAVGPRPHVRLHGDIRKQLEGVHASVLLVDLVREEARMRAELVDATTASGLKHAHMVGVTRDALLAGLATEPTRIASLARALKRHLQPTSRIHVRSSRGTDLVVRCHPSYAWTEASGALRAGEYANVPAGEMIAHTADVDGIYVADGTLGDADGDLGAKLGDDPLVIRLDRGRVVSVDTKNTVRAVRIKQRMASMRDLDRVGMIVFGTNLGLGEPTGSIAVDQKAPGLHLCFGHTMRARTGAAWDVASWIGVSAQRLDVDIDGAPVLRGGRYLFTA